MSLWYEYISMCYKVRPIYNPLMYYLLSENDFNGHILNFIKCTAYRKCPKKHKYDVNFTKKMFKNVETFIFIKQCKYFKIVT